MKYDRKTNIAPETRELAKMSSFWEGLLAGAMLVFGSVSSFRGGVKKGLSTCFQFPRW